MTVKTCLLVTDDPDDHHAFSEALAEISEDAIVVNVLDSQKALKLLSAGRHAPDYLFLDLSMNGIRINSFLKTIKSDDALRKIPTVVYGDQSAFEQISHFEDLVFFDEDYEYSELKNFLGNFIKPLGT
jgi:CheY-like chemotaxis protein